MMLLPFCFLDVPLFYLLIRRLTQKKIALLGIENWGFNMNFARYGDLKKAHAGTEKYPVKLLILWWSTARH